MNCLVIMPFAPEFDDVYDAVKKAIEDAVEEPGSCARLDESRPAGRITNRLTNELRSATFCIADITHERPNVMWELGYAMALEKPTIVITQSVSKLPFDIADVETIVYERNRLRRTLSDPLKKVAIDTLTAIRTGGLEADATSAPTDTELAMLRRDLSEFKSMILEVVRASQSSGDTVSLQASEMKKLTGSWVNAETGSHAYASLVNSELVAPYSFGSNDSLTGVYFGWRQMGEYWFGRYQWIGADVCGFTFLKQHAVDLLKGAWWSSSSEDHPIAPPDKQGVPATWRRIESPVPEWAKTFIDLATQKGVKDAIRLLAYAKGRELGL